MTIKHFDVLCNAPEIRSFTERDPATGERKVIAEAIVNSEVRITIDLAKLAANMGPQAIRNKSGRCIEAGGAVIVKRANPVQR